MHKDLKNFATRMRNEVTLCKYQWLHQLDNLENLYKSSDSHDDRATFLAERRSIILQLSACFDEKDNTFAKKGIDVDFLTDFQESQIDNIGVSNGNASHIIDTLNTLVQSYQEENDELIRNISSSKPNQ